MSCSNSCWSIFCITQMVEKMMGVVSHVSCLIAAVHAAAHELLQTSLWLLQLQRLRQLPAYRTVPVVIAVNSVAGYILDFPNRTKKLQLGILMCLRSYCGTASKVMWFAKLLYSPAILNRLLGYITKWSFWYQKGRRKGNLHSMMNQFWKNFLSEGPWDLSTLDTDMTRLRALAN